VRKKRKKKKAINYLLGSPTVTGKKKKGGKEGSFSLFSHLTWGKGEGEEPCLPIKRKKNTEKKEGEKKKKGDREQYAGIYIPIEKGKKGKKKCTFRDNIWYKEERGGGKSSGISRSFYSAKSIRQKKEGKDMLTNNRKKRLLLKGKGGKKGGPGYTRYIPQTLEGKRKGKGLYYGCNT